MCISLDNAKDSNDYGDRQERHMRLLARRNELRVLIKEKYPEVAEYLATYFAEKEWR